MPKLLALLTTLLMMATLTACAPFMPRYLTIASVDGAPISAAKYSQRAAYENLVLENQLERYKELRIQFNATGVVGVLDAQISQIESRLADPERVATGALTRIVADVIIAKEAERRGLTITQAEIDSALLEEMANSIGQVSAPQATATAIAATVATATAFAMGSSPTDAPSPMPALTAAIIDDASYEYQLHTLEATLATGAHMTLADYREIVKARLLEEKVKGALATEQVSPTAEQVWARHILVTGDADVGRQEIEELHTRIIDGEDFGELARQYSDDPGSGAKGGDLGWFGRGMMVAPFEDVAFRLAVGEVSEPFQTDFGYHLVEVLGHDMARPKDTGALDLEREMLFRDWLLRQLDSDRVKVNLPTIRMPLSAYW